MTFELRVALTLASRIALAALGLVSGVILARGLGPDGKGAFELVVLVSTLGVSWGGLGVDLAVTYFASRGSFPEHDLKRTLLWLGIVLGGAVGLIVLLVTRSLGGAVLPGVDPSLLLLAAGLIPFLLTQQYQRAVLLGRDRLLAYNAVNLASSGAICLGLLVVVIGLGSELHGVVWAYVVAQLLTLVLVLRLNRTPMWPSLAKSATIARALLTFGSKAQVGNTLQYVSLRADLFIINWFLGTAAVGYYSVAVALAEVVWYLPRTVGLVLLPYIAPKSHQDAERVTPAICRQTMLLSLCAALALVGLGPLIVTTFFGEAFWPAVVPLWLLLPGVVVASWVKPLASYQLGRGRPLTSLYVALLSAPFCIAAYLLLIPRFGIVGAAVASSIAYTAMALFELLFLFRFSSIRLAELLVPRRSDWTVYRSLLVRAGQVIQRAYSGFVPPRSRLSR